MTKPKKRSKHAKRMQLRLDDIHAAIVESTNLDIYASYCAGYARQMQQNDIASTLMPCSHDARMIAAFAIGQQHADSRSLLCRLDEVVAAVEAYTEQPKRVS